MRSIVFVALMSLSMSVPARAQMAPAANFRPAPFVPLRAWGGGARVWNRPANAQTVRNLRLVVRPGPSVSQMPDPGWATRGTSQASIGPSSASSAATPPATNVRSSTRRYWFQGDPVQTPQYDAAPTPPSVRTIRPPTQEQRPNVGVNRINPGNMLRLGSLCEGGECNRAGLGVSTARSQTGRRYTVTAAACADCGTYGVFTEGPGVGVPFRRTVLVPGGSPSASRAAGRRIYQGETGRIPSRIDERTVIRGERNALNEARWRAQNSDSGN